MREGTVILLENMQGSIAFQLRDNRPDVSYPDHWGLFGGWLEGDETPEQGIQREMVEELGLPLEAARLEYVKLHRDGDVIAHVFHYPAPSGISSTILREGQRLEFLNLSDLETRRVVPRHRSIIMWYEKHRRTHDPLSPSPAS
jgi:8-oxo-dGTP pyrophosphatase MutT (NUDIX family)